MMNKISSLLKCESWHKQALRAQTEAAKRHGIFGAPSWRTADGELFWGNDRLDEAIDWARGPKFAQQPGTGVSYS